jgi:hypothetical protein
VGDGGVLRVKLGVGEGALRRSFNQGNEPDNTRGSGDDPSPGGGARVTLIWLDDSGLGRKWRRVFFVLHGRSSRGIYIGAASGREAKGLLAESISNSKLESHFGWDSELELVFDWGKFSPNGGDGGLGQHSARLCVLLCKIVVCVEVKGKKRVEKKKKEMGKIGKKEI